MLSNAERRTPNFEEENPLRLLALERKTGEEQHAMQRGRGPTPYIWGLGIIALSAMLALIAPTARSAEDNQPPPKRQLTPEQLLRKRINDALADRRDLRAPRSETLAGPELTEEEKVTQ